MLKLVIVCRDEEYSKALAAALAEFPALGRSFGDIQSLDYEGALAADFSRCVVLSTEKDFLSKVSDGILLDEERPDGWETPFLSRSLPLPALVSYLLALHTSCAGRTVKKDNCKFTAFTGGCGGSGVSSCAQMYGRVLARQYGKTPALLSLDPPFRRSTITGRDEYGLVYLSTSDFSAASDAEALGEALFRLCLEEEYSDLILDIPSCVPGFRDFLDMCERRVIVYGWLSHRHNASGRLLAMLEAESAYYTENCPVNIKLYNHYDDFSFEGPELDLHGQLGREIRELAQELEKY